MNELCVVVVLLLTVACSGHSASPRPVRVGSEGFLDPGGRHLILRGPNVRAAAFMDAFHEDTPPAPFDAAQDCRALARDFGLNAIRLTLSWSLIEPTQGQYDETYFRNVQATVDACGAAGVFTLLDLHQDGYSKYIGNDGAPRWAHPDPLPPADTSQGGGSDPTTHPAISDAFTNLFTEGSAVGEAYVALVAKLVQRFGNDPNVLGVEILNEPYALLQPDLLFGFYARVIAGARKVNKDVPIFLEPSAERNVLDSVALPGQLPFSGTNIVYAPHLYTGVFATPWTPGDAARIQNSVVGMGTEAGSLGLPLFVGEWGGPDDQERGRPWSDIAVEAFDAKGISWSNWSFDEHSAKCANVGPGYCTAYFDLVADPSAPTGYRRDGYRRDAIDLYARPFPRAISGTLESFQYDAASKALTVRGQLKGDQELSLPALTYPGGAVVVCDGAAAKTAVREGVVLATCSGRQLTLSPH